MRTPHSRSGHFNPLVIRQQRAALIFSLFQPYFRLFLLSRAVSRDFQEYETGENSAGVSSLNRLQLPAQNMDEGLDGEFDEEKRFGDEIIAAGHGGAGAVVEVAQSGDEDDGGLFMGGQGAEFGAEFKAAHAGHVHVQKDKVKRLFGQ